MGGLKPLSSLYRKLVGLKNYLYEHEYFEAVELPVPVLSLGNLTMGGTGKTPLTDFCLKYYQRRHLKTAVVSRNYKAQVDEIAEVDCSRENAAAYFGDEPVLLAERNPQAHFFVGPRKYETAQFAVDKIQPDLVLVDDGFQHRQLHRDVDLVILDATEPFENYACIPQGRAREPWESLSRATAFVITKANLAGASQVEQLTEKLRPFGKPVIPLNYGLRKLCGLQAGVEKSLTECQGQKALLVSGLAQPRSFEASLEEASLVVAGHVIFRDHHPYTVADVEKILRQWREAGSPLLVTTEKDVVKLRGLWPQDVPLWYSPLEVNISAMEDAFYEVLDQVLH